MPSPLWLLHGFTGCAAVWTDVRAALDSSLQTQAIDLPGHGALTDLDDPQRYTFASVIAEIVGHLDHAGHTAVTLWGYSMGGRIALQFALAHPHRVRRLVLESASPGIADDSERAQRRHADDQLASEIESRGVDWFVERWLDQPLFASQKSLPAERFERGQALRRQNHAAGLARALRGFSVGRQAALHNRLPELTMPTLVLAGAQDAKYRAIGEAMARSIPNAQLCIIPAAGHSPHWERPQATAAAVSAFLKASESES